jgi:two-component sensor histidine kinase
LLNCPHGAIRGVPLIVFLRAREYRRLVTELPAGSSDAVKLYEREISVYPVRKPAIIVAATVGVARNGDGRKVGLRWQLRDITERKAVEARLHASLQEKELLLREVYHRVKNNLQVISSLLSLQEHQLTDPDAVTVLRHARDRVRSMALVHEKLYRSTDLSRVDFTDYLRQLARELRHSYGITSRQVEFGFHLEEASLGIDVAIPCSMIVHELVSNALRHAFPDGRRGRIQIALGPETPGWARLEVADDGIGLPPEDEPRHTGSLGLQLVAMMVEQIGGRLTVARDAGTRFSVVFPPSSLGSSAPAHGNGASAR